MKDDRQKRIPSEPFIGSEFADEEFDEIRTILLEHRGFDLGMYKDRCVKRRIATRVRALGYKDAGSYLTMLRGNEDEIDTLLAALTIHVSQFFRNPSTFAVLEKRILPELIRRARQDHRQEIRLWSVGCAGGEEPYSLALMIDELAVEDLNISILGTDVSTPILEQARQGLFDGQRLVEVPESVRERYFTAEGRRYRIRPDLRDMVRFEWHNVLKAADYPRADLILCRNVLIYFSRTEQENILQRFADSLSAGGSLVLGRAETLLGAFRRSFSVECPEERIYRRN